MKKHYNYLTIDLDKKVYSKLRAMQFDTKSRYILINLISNNIAYDLTDTSIKIYGLKNDKKEFFNNAVIKNAKEGQFEIELTNQALAAHGQLEIQILILGANGEKLTSSSFYIEVGKSNISESAIESTNEFNVLTEGLKNLSEYDVYKSNVLKNKENIAINNKKLVAHDEQFEEVEKKVNDALNYKMDKTAVMTMANMGQDVKEAMTGGSVAVVGRNTVVRENIVDNQVTPDKASFMEDMVNIFDKATVIKGNLVDPYSGSLQNNALHCASDYIAINPSTKYISNRKGHVAFYGDDKTYISGLHENDFYSTGLKLTTPSNASYVRFSVADYTTVNQDYNTCMFMKGEALPDTFIGFMIAKLKRECMPSIDIKGEDIKNIPVESCNFLIATTNYELADRKNVQKGQMMNYGDFSPNSGHTGFLTFVEVKPTTSYTINKKVNICWYNSSKAYIDQQNGVTGAITSPAGSAYVRWSIEGTSDNDIQTTSFMETQYVGSGGDGRAKFDETKINMDKYLGGSGGDTSSNINQWKGKKWCTYGDSITENNYYQPYVNEKLQFAQIYNKGMGGTTVSHNNSANWFGSDTRINSIPLDTDLITIMGGTNDATWVDIGEITYPFNEDTFIGGLCSTIKKIQTRLPNARIVLCSPLSGRGQTGQNGVLQEANNKGKVTGDFAKAVELVAHYFSIPFIDVFSLTGINQMNRTAYIADTVHPNSKGGQLIAKVLIKGLENIETFKVV